MKTLTASSLKILHYPFMIMSFLLCSSLTYASDTDSSSIHRVNDTLMVDTGHCPGEGCIYGKWTSHQTIPIFKAPYDTTKTGLIHPGESFTAITGNVYFVPEIVILRNEENSCAYNEKGYISVQTGDTVYVLTNIGEDHYKVRIRDEYGIADCWGNDNYEAWWVKVTTKRNLNGWILYNPGLKISGSDAFE